MTPEQTEELKQDILRDWSSRSNDWKIRCAEIMLGFKDFDKALYKFAKENESDFRRFLEDKYKVEDKYIKSKWEDD